MRSHGARRVAKRVRTLARLAFVVLAGAVGCADERAPNLVVIVADDLGWNDVGWNGSEIRTPTLDRLASEGVRLSSFYTPPRCSPSRAALLTGRHPYRYGLQVDVVRPWADYGLTGAEATIAEALAGVGYRTHLVGKWHLGHHAREHVPTQHGFDHHYGSYLGQVDHFRHESLGGLDWHRDGRPQQERGHTTQLLADEAVRVVESRDPARPLFLLVAFHAPHVPLQAPREWVDRQRHVDGPERRVFAAMVEMLDAAVGRIVEALEREGIDRETVLVFASDNGGGTSFGADNAPFTGGKGELLEGGVRVPALVVARGRLAGGQELADPVHMVDLHPTLAALAGAEVAADLDGADLWPALAGEAPLADRALVIHAEPDAAALRRGPWKLRVTRDGAASEHTLHDVVADPAEQRDLAGERPEILAELSEVLARATADAAAPLGGPRRPPPGFAAPEIWGPAGRPSD